MKNIGRKLHPAKTFAGFLALLSLLASPRVFADGDSRVPNAAEKAFSKSVLETFSKALPPGPEGWDKDQSTEVKEATVLYSDPGQAFQVNYLISWKDSKKLQEAAVNQAQELEKLAKGPAENLTEKNISAITKKTEAHDAMVKITVDANIYSKGIQEKISAAAPVAGGLVYKSESGYQSGGSWREGATYIFLGKGWKITSSSSGGTYVETKAVKGASSTAVQTILVVVQADPERSKQIVAKTDWDALNKLLKN